MVEIEMLGSGRVAVLGHRGAMGHAPENTMASFRKALDLGVDAVELDVRLTGDQEVVVIHDASVDRTTNGTGLVSEMALSDLQALDAGSGFAPGFRGERVPTLAQVLAWAAGRTELVIEIKGDPEPAPGLLEKTVALIRAHGLSSSVMVISFYHPAVRQARNLDTEIATGILCGGFPADPVGAARAAAADSVRPSWHYVNPELVSVLHEAEIVVSPWTVNDVPAMERLISMGVDSIGTNYPDRLCALIDRES
jgi:glycerophosphoryl diester phosphodiesterase